MNGLLPSTPDAGPGDRMPWRTAAAAVLVIAGLGFSAGWLVGRLLPRPAGAPGDAAELRAGSTRFINPLLECLGDDVQGFAELRSFQNGLEWFIAGRTGRGGIADAAVYFRDMNNGPWFGIREQDKFIPASLLKLPIVIAAMKQAEQDPSFLSRPVRNDLAGDHTDRQFVKPTSSLQRGKSYTVDELIEACIVRSDNNAQQLLVRAVDRDVLLGVFRDLGVPAPRLNIQYDFMSTRRYASFFRILFNASYLSRPSSQRLLELLARTEYRGGLAAGIPAHVLVAHKFGEHASPAPGGPLQLHDCGIVYYPGHPYLLCVMTRGSDFAAMTGLRGSAAAPSPRAVRLGMNDLINPLLECETAERIIADPVLPPFREDLAGQVDGLIRSGRVGRMAVFFRDLNNGPWVGVNADEAFYPASLLKVPVAMAVLRQAERDPGLLAMRISAEVPRDLNATRVVRPRREVRPGRSYTVAELIELTLLASDNNALQLLTKSVDREDLAATFRDLSVRYPSSEQADFMSVKDFATFFRILYNASYLGRASSERLLEVMSRAEFADGLRAGVPGEIAVAHKYGEQTMEPDGTVRELHDCGIVYYPNSPYLLCVMSTGASYERNAEAIRGISAFVFGIVDRHQRSLAAGRSGEGRHGDR